MEAPLTITISSSNNKITITVVIAFHFSGITLLITKPQSHIFETARSTEQPALPPYVPTSLRPSQAPKQSLMTITATSTPHIYRVSPYERDRIFHLPPVCVFDCFVRHFAHYLEFEDFHNDDSHLRRQKTFISEVSSSLWF